MDISSCLSSVANIRYSNCINIDTREVLIRPTKECCHKNNGHFIPKLNLCSNDISSDYTICCMTYTKKNEIIGIWSNYTVIEGRMIHNHEQMNCLNKKHKKGENKWNYHQHPPNVTLLPHGGFHKKNLILFIGLVIAGESNARGFVEHALAVVIKNQALTHNIESLKDVLPNIKTEDELIKALFVYPVVINRLSGGFLGSNFDVKLDKDGETLISDATTNENKIKRITYEGGTIGIRHSLVTTNKILNAMELPKNKNVVKAMIDAYVRNNKFLGTDFNKPVTEAYKDIWGMKKSPRGVGMTGYYSSLLRVHDDLNTNKIVMTNGMKNAIANVVRARTRYNVEMIKNYNLVTSALSKFVGPMKMGDIKNNHPDIYDAMKSQGIIKQGTAIDTIINDSDIYNSLNLKRYSNSVVGHKVLKGLFVNMFNINGPLFDANANSMKSFSLVADKNKKTEYPEDIQLIDKTSLVIKRC
ncbi:unnamed protein product [Cunninghamella echinulata]